ncbi:hypothetical protein A6A03_18835 [Chloroflexus islandicus]|uniref:Uncharacterized protein n=1 Tax=Chloroflexus islandicus TaxID=1707952 RepID=A0A178M159_9CHLR|nr:hypothetical protein [Chloroflexus islandicus]OAN41708.1 hypothetical protein A6A03_18835 [Chloroflexus islandicus]
MSIQCVVQLQFVSRDPAYPDPAAVSAYADLVIADLRSRGLTVQPVYTGAMGGDVYEVIRQLAEAVTTNKEILAAMISGVLATIVSTLADRLKGSKLSSTTPPFTIEVNIEHVRTEMTVPEVAVPEIDPEALLRQLLAIDPELPAKISPDTKLNIKVRVPAQRGRS